MAVFVYQGRTASGVQNGEIEASDRSAAVGELRRRAILVTKISEKSAPKIAFKFGGKVKDKEMAIFTRQFSTMIDAGLPLVQCLDILAEQQNNAFFKDVLRQVRQNVEEGATLYAALERHPKVFDALYTHMVEAGETGGVLDLILQRTGRRGQLDGQRDRLLSPRIDQGHVSESPDGCANDA